MSREGERNLAGSREGERNLARRKEGERNLARNQHWRARIKGSGVGAKLHVWPRDSKPDVLRFRRRRRVSCAVTAAAVGLSATKDGKLIGQAFMETPRPKTGCQRQEVGLGPEEPGFGSAGERAGSVPFTALMMTSAKDESNDSQNKQNAW